MHGKAVLIVLIFLGTGFAGCLKGADNGPAVDPASANNSTLLANQTIAPNGAGSISAFNETNKTETKGIGAQMHAHDYWKGKERLDVGWIGVSLIPFPAAPCKKPNGDCSVGSTTPSADGSGDTYPVGTDIADFLMTPGMIGGMIYEGTKTVEFTMKDLTVSGTPAGNTPANPAGQVFIDYLAANDEPGHFHHGGELKVGQSLKIDIKPTDADMPHQTKSLWVYRVYSNSQMGAFQANVTITLNKGYDVVNWPPHPNLYADKPTRTVFDGPVKLSSKGTADANIWGSDAGWVHPQRVISWGSDKVDIAITDVVFTSDTGAPITPTSYIFEYNNASKPPLLGNGAQYSGRMHDATSDGKSYHFSLDLTKDDGQQYDTPYAQYSRWGFRLVPQFDQAAATCPEHIDTPNGDVGPFAQEFLVGCQYVPWTAAYKMTIVTTGHSTAEGAPASAS